MNLLKASDNLQKELKRLSEDPFCQYVFEHSGMKNEHDRLGFGFFPLGNGILSESNKVGECKVLILGNDFGTEDYLTECDSKGKRESDTKSPTIRNLLNQLQLERNTTFFSNLHLGVRLKGTNTKRSHELSSCYKTICYDFLLVQLKVLNPSIVLCLGNEVRETLLEKSDLFTDWEPMLSTFKQLYSDGRFQTEINSKKLGKRKFVIVPHPCDGRNFLKEYTDKIKLIIEQQNT